MAVTTNKFECSRCGLCCRRLGTLSWAKDMIDTAGVCKYLNKKTNLCSIYEHRPIFCNVDAYYEKYLSDKMPRSEYYSLNEEFCRKFQREDISHSTAIQHNHKQPQK